MQKSPKKKKCRNKNTVLGPNRTAASSGSYQTFIYWHGVIARDLQGLLLYYFDQMFIIFRFSSTEVTDKFSFEL
jgi:hypothetical protein